MSINIIFQMENTKVILMQMWNKKHSKQMEKQLG